MIVYHGSEKEIKKPIYRGSRMGTDFGCGFYCTENCPIPNKLDIVNSFFLAFS